jgi:hypothetical protein
MLKHALKNCWLDDAAGTSSPQISLKSTKQTFVGTQFCASENVCHKGRIMIRRTKCVSLQQNRASANVRHR